MSGSVPDICQHIRTFSRENKGNYHCDKIKWEKIGIKEKKESLTDLIKVVAISLRGEGDVPAAIRDDLKVWRWKL